jgi:putative phage-type endonuclease
MAAPRVMTPTAGMDRDEWLAWRRQGLGASDAAAVLGQDPWTSPWVLYLDKRGELPDDGDAGEAAYWGRVLEDTIAREYASRTGARVHRRNAILASPSETPMLASPDRYIDAAAAPDGHQGRGYLEIKSTSAFKADEWAHGEAPLAYHLQWQHAACVLDVTWGALACLVGGQQLVVRHMERDDELVSHLRDAERRFWYDHVRAGVPPAIDGSDSTRRALERLYAEPDPTRFGAELDDDAVDAARRYRAAHQRIKIAESDKEQAGNELRASLGDFEVGHEPDVPLDSKPLVEWRAVTQTRLDTKTLRLEQPELAAKYDTTSHQRRLTVRDPKE